MALPNCGESFLHLFPRDSHGAGFGMITAAFVHMKHSSKAVLANKFQKIGWLAVA
jgi:hypothetical protein